LNGELVAGTLVKVDGVAPQMPHHDRYHSFADLRSNEVEGKDYLRKARHRAGARIAVIAPHGGAIEHHTSEIAEAIAEDDFCLYQFEGTKPSENYRDLHVTSHNFDEPLCLELISACDRVVAVHGCPGTEERIFIGGLDDELVQLVASELAASEFAVEVIGHRYPAKDPRNICNRGASGQGVQLELTDALRRGQNAMNVALAVRRALAQVSVQP
jgi:phage replication-related protein YjqB (UPF0714/DUF867 family)